MAAHSQFSLEGVDNICVHYAHTLKEWRHRFNRNVDKVGYPAALPPALAPPPPAAAVSHASDADIPCKTLEGYGHLVVSNADANPRQVFPTEAGAGGVLKAKARALRDMGFPTGTDSTRRQASLEHGRWRKPIPGRKQCLRHSEGWLCAVI